MGIRVIRDFDKPGLDTRIDQALRTAWSRCPRTPDDYDWLSAKSLLLDRISKPRDFEEGKSWHEPTFLAMNARFCVKVHLAEVLYGDQQKGIMYLDEADLDRCDPLYGGLWLGDEDEWLKTAPFEVVFSTSSVKLGKYRENPYYIPSFSIVERTHLAERRFVKKGQRRNLNYFEVPYHSHRSLHRQRTRYESALKNALPGYLKWRGLSSLTRTQRLIVLETNRTHASKGEVQNSLRIKKSTYYDALDGIFYRGFDEDIDRNGKRILTYNPVLDSTVRIIDEQALCILKRRPMMEVIVENEYLFNQILGDPYISPSGIAEKAFEQRQAEIRAKMNMDAIEQHDKRLRQFIRFSIEEPVMGKGATVEEIDAMLKMVGRKKARQLVYESLRFRRPVLELIGLERFEFQPSAAFAA